MNVVSRGTRNAFRNAIRTFSIVIILGLSMGLSLVMLIAHQAVGNKIESVKSSIGNSVTIRPAGFNSLSETNNGLSTSQLDKLDSISSITKLTETLGGVLRTEGSSSSMPGGGGQSQNGGRSQGETNLTSPVTINGQGSGLVINGGDVPENFSPPISIHGTTDPTGNIGQLNASVTVTSGTAIDGTKDSNEALISEAMAAKNNLQVGSAFTAYDTALTVTGIFKSNTEAGNNVVIVSLPTFQRLSGNAGAVAEAVATVDSISNIDTATEAVKKELGSSADVTNSKETVEKAIKPLQGIQAVSLYSLIGAVVASGVIILLTMTMIVRERKREIGVLKALGFSNIRIMVQFMSEALTFAILGAIAGLAAGVIAGDPVTQALVDNSANSSTENGRMVVDKTVQGITNIQAEIGWTIIFYGLGVAILIALVGSALASYFIAKVRPAEVLRSE